MKFGTFFTLFEDSNRRYECDEIIIKNRMIKTHERSGWLSFFVSNGGGGCWLQLSLPSLAMPNFCDTSKSWHRVLIWIHWNGKKWAIQFYSSESHPNPLNFTIAWFSTSKEYWESVPFFCFVSKGSNQFGTCLGFTLRLTVNVKSGIGNFIREGEKKLSLPVVLSVELVYFWQHLWDKCCHINKEHEQSLPL